MIRGNPPASITPIVLLLALVTGVAMPAQQAPTDAGSPDVTKLGPQVGQKVPDFTLPDQDGRSRTLASLSGPKGLMLVFNRSADW